MLRRASNRKIAKSASATWVITVTTLGVSVQPFATQIKMVLMSTSPL